jgi:short-subunit dehydrogenase
MKNRIVMVTGASSGIGEAAARAMARLGATVVITSEREEDLLKAAESINAEARSAGGKAIPIVVDFSRPDQVADLAERAEALAGPIDTVVNNAGVGMRCLIGERPFDDTRFVFEVNFFALASLCTQFLQRMQERNSGRIINISSAAGQFGCANMSTYSATKGAVHAYTQALRVEARVHGVWVSEVVPISVRTPFFERARGKAYRPLGVVLTPERVAQSIVKCACAAHPAPEVWPYWPIRFAFLANVLAPGLMVLANTKTFRRNRAMHKDM